MADHVKNYDKDKVIQDLGLDPDDEKIVRRVNALFGDDLDYDPSSSTGRHITTGNRCGTDIRVGYEMPKRLKNRIKFLNKAKKKLSEYPWMTGVLYNENTDFSTRRTWWKKFVSSRRERSESRWAFFFMSSTLMDYLDCFTFSLGNWEEETGQLRAYTLKELWEKLVERLPADMDFSFSRFKRQWALLKKMGYARVEKRHYSVKDPVTGEELIRQDVALKYITPKFFSSLGITRANMEEAKGDSKKRVIKTLTKYVKRTKGTLSVDKLNEYVRKLMTDWKQARGAVRILLEDYCNSQQQQPLTS